MPKSQPSGTVRRAVVPLLMGALVAGALLVSAPAQAQRIRPGFWGMHDVDWTTPPSVPVGSANFTTSGTYWPRVQTGRRTFDWSRLDAQVAAAEAIGAQPMIVLGQTPRFASTRRGSVDYHDYPPKIRLWRHYVSKVARRYGARLDYQIWPEPNIVQNWKGTPRGMAKLTMVASRAINRQSRKAKVVSPAVVMRLPEQQRWLVDYFRQTVGGRRVHRYVDAIAIDPFPEQRGTPEDSYALMSSIRRQLAHVGVRKPIWTNEINYGVAGGGATTRTRYSMDKQQSFVIRTYVLGAAARMKRTYWLGWFRTAAMAVHMTGASGRRRPTATSYEVVRSWLNRTSFRGCRQDGRGLWTCTARPGPREVRRIYWKPRGGAVTVRIPSSARVEGQEGGVNTSPGRTIRVDFRPRMVASRR